MATAIPFGWTVQNAAGTAVSGAKVYFTIPGTATPRSAFTDTGLTVPAANPVEADAAGWFKVYLSSELSYDIVIKSADDSITYQERTVASNIAGAQPVDATLTALAGLVVASGDIIEATGVDTFRTRKFQVATYAAARLLSGLTVGDRVHVDGRASSGDGGEGWFRVAAGGTDNDGITLVMADSKALIREDIQEVIRADWFGIVPGTVDVTDWNEMIDAVALRETRTVELRGGTYVFPSKPDAFTTIVRLKGQGSSITILERGYSEAGGDTVAFLQFEDAAASNSGIEDLQLRPAAGTTGGTMLRFYATTTTILSWCEMQNCVITPDSGNYIWGLIVDGLANTISGSQGVRNFRSENSFIFKGSTDKCAAFYNATNGFHSGLWTNGDVLISGGGSSLTNTFNFRMVGLVCLGTLTIEQCNEVHISGTMEDIDVAASVTSLTLMGDCATLDVATGATGVANVYARTSVSNGAPTTFTLTYQGGVIGGASPYGAFTIGRASVDYNVTTDQAITISLPPGFTRFRLLSIIAVLDSGNGSSAVGGLYTAASKAGTAIVANTQQYTALTGANTNQAMSVSAAGVQIMSGSTFYFSLTTAAGVAAAGQVFIVAYPIT